MSSASTPELFDDAFTQSLSHHTHEVMQAINLVDNEHSRADIVDSLNVKATEGGFVGRRALLSSDIMVRYEQTINYTTNGFTTRAVHKDVETTDCKGVFVGFESWKLGDRRILMYRLEVPMDSDGVFVSAFAPVEGSELSIYKHNEELAELAYKRNVEKLEAAMNYLSDFDDSDSYQEALADFAEFYIEVIDGKPDATDIASLGINLENLWKTDDSVVDDDRAISLSMELVLNLINGHHVYSIMGHELLTQLTEDGVPKIIEAYNTNRTFEYEISGLGTMNDYVDDSASQSLIPIFIATNDEGETCLLPLKYILEFEDLGQR